MGTGAEAPGGDKAPEAQEHREEYVRRSAVLRRLRP